MGATVGAPQSVSCWCPVLIYFYKRAIRYPFPKCLPFSKCSAHLNPVTRPISCIAFNNEPPSRFAMKCVHYHPPKMPGDAPKAAHIARYGKSEIASGHRRSLHRSYLPPASLRGIESASHHARASRKSSIDYLNHQRPEQYFREVKALEFKHK
jgi:hypothetical protein